MKNNFIQRAVTGVLFVIVLVGCILYSPLSVRYTVHHYQRTERT